jgi:hypothetical protein
MVKTKSKVMVFVVFLLLVGCAGNGPHGSDTQFFSQTAYNTIFTAAQAYSTTMKSLADLYSKGLITETEKQKTIKYGEDFWLAYHTSLDAFEEYQRTKREAPVYTALSTLSKALGSFLEYAQKVQQKEGK